jgi:hypothetical protein
MDALRKAIGDVPRLSRVKPAAVTDVIDAARAQVTIRMFNGNAHPHGL